MKKKTKGILLFATATAAMHAYNRYVNDDAVKKNILKDDKGFYYKWKLGEIYYTKEGVGSPILLIHDIQPSSSSFEWKRTVSHLRKTNTVYTLDLLGCGRSDKPNVTYTTYLYVQLITEFVKNVIQEKTDVVVSNLSGSFVLTANQMDETLFDNIILVNPISVRQMQSTVNSIFRFKKRLINLPIIGTFLYNINMHPSVMDLTFRKRCSSDIHSISPDIIDTFYESAHLKSSRGKYLYASILGNYMNMDLYRIVKKNDKTIYILYSQNLRKAIPIVTEYHKINSKIMTRAIDSGSPYPQIGDSHKVYRAIKEIIRHSNTAETR